MRIDLYVYDDAGKLKPIDLDCALGVVPRVGETISLGSRQASAKIMSVEYLIPSTGEEVLVGIILDKVPGA